MTGLQREEFTNEPVNQACAVVTMTLAPLLVDTGATWETVEANDVPLAAANFSSVMNDASYISLDDANDEIDLKPGKYELRLEAVLQNADGAVASLYGLALTNETGDTAHLLIEDEDLLAADTSGVARHVSATVLLTVPGSIGGTIARLSVRAAARTASGDVDLLPSSRLVIRRLGN